MATPIDPKSCYEIWSQLPDYQKIVTAIIVALGLWLFVRFHRLRYRNIYDKRKTRIDIIDSHIKSDIKISSCLQEILMMEREDQVFTHAFGYSLDRPRREKLIPILKADDCPTSWSQIENARQYLKIDKGELVVRFTFWDTLWFYTNHVMAIFYMLIAAIWLLAIWNAPTLSVIVRSLLVFAAIPMYAFAGFMIYTTFGYSTAKKIKKWQKARREASECVASGQSANHKPH